MLFTENKLIDDLLSVSRVLSVLTKVVQEGAWLSFYVLYIAGCLELFSYARYPTPFLKSFDDYDADHLSSMAAPEAENGRSSVRYPF